MEYSTTTNIRLNWLDWMKVIGMYLIVYGHFSSYGHKFIYTFSVPLFFMISGFLFKKEENIRFFFKKNFYNLIVPMLILVTIIQIRFVVPLVIKGTFELSQIPTIILGIIVGNQKILGSCWFIYTLFLIKILQQIIQSSKRWKGLQIFVFIIFSGICILLSHLEIFAQNAIINTFLSYQFFVIGFMLKRYISVFNKVMKIYQGVFVIIVAYLITYLCSKYNGNVWCYINDYGKSFALYLIGGLSGSTIIFVMSKFLDKVQSSLVTTISSGSIIILGLHYELIKFFKISPELDFLSAFLILILFIPIIRICEKKAPILIGTYRIKKNNEC